jgi:hypothetical protein
MNRTTALLAGGMFTLLLGVAACSTPAQIGSATGPGPTSTAAQPTAPVSDRALPPPAETDCSLGQLNVSDGNGGAGSTHRATILVFRNKSAVTCHLAGYPGVAGLNAGDQQIAQATRTLSGYLGGAKSAATVELSPGQSASATVETMAIDAATGNSCTPYAGILVTPPNETHSIKLAWPNDGCSALQIHPVVPGTTGSQS